MIRHAGWFRGAVGVAVVLAGVAPALAEPMRVKGTRVSLEAPPGFVQAEKFPGLQHPDHPLASIVVAEVPAPIATLRAALTKENLTARGLTLVAMTEHTVGGQPAHLVQATQDTPLGAVGKWLLLNTLLFSETGQSTQTDATKAMFIVGSSINASTITDVKGAAEARLAGFVSAGQIGEPGAPKATMLKVDGLDACELVADATDPKSGTPITVYVVMVAEPGKGYYLTTGMVGRARAAEWLPAFRAATATLRRVTP